MKLTRTIVSVVVAFDVLAILYMGTLAFAPVTAVTVVGNDKILNPGKQVRQGDALIYQITYCKYTDKQAAVTRALVGKSVTYPLPASTNNVPRGCQTAISRNTLIPDGVEPGTYHLALSATYQINPLHAVTVSHHSEDFTVLPKAASGATSSSVSAPVTQTVPSIGLGSTSAPAASSAPFHTDQVSQEPTQPTPTPAPSPPPAPSLLSRILSAIKGLGI